MEWMVAAGKKSDLICLLVTSDSLVRSQSGICQTDIKAITLPFYGCGLFYPSIECMSTECPVM